MVCFSPSISSLRSIEKIGQFAGLSANWNCVRKLGFSSLCMYLCLLSLRVCGYHFVCSAYWACISSLRANRHTVGGGPQTTPPNQKSSNGLISRRFLQMMPPAFTTLGNPHGKPEGAL